MKKVVQSISIVILTCFTINSSGAGERISELYDQARAKCRYKTPGQNVLDEAEALFSDIFSGSRSASEKAARLHFVMKTVTEHQKEYIVLYEHPDYRSGRGFYLFPAVPGGGSVLELPHGYRDLYTGDIGVKMALEGRFAGVAWNTVPRYYTIDGKRLEADLSDLKDTFLAAFTRAFIRRRPDGHVIQLHGFSQKKRRSESGESADIILSNGSSTPTPLVARMDDCLESKYKHTIAYYPIEVKELGATQTSIGIIMREMKSDRFLHIEMSRPFRIKLRDDRNYRRNMIDCFESVLP